MDDGNEGATGAEILLMFLVTIVMAAAGFILTS